MAKGQGKGSDFERVICKRLSKWWTNGLRDDVFWRSQTSGGRATRRKKSGKTTYGSYGDIAAVDPIGEPLLKMWTIELKCGRSHGSLLDLLDCPAHQGCQPFEAALIQAHRSHLDARSMGWMLISHKDHRETIVCIDWDTFRLFKLPCRARIRGRETDLTFAVLPLEDMCDLLVPKQIIEQL